MLRKRGDDWPTAVDQFLSWLPNHNTRRTYGPLLKAALVLLGSLYIGDWQASDIGSLSVALAAIPHSPSTRRLQVAAVRAFLKWGRAMGLTKLSPETVDLLLPMPRKVEAVSYQSVTDETAARLLREAREGRDRVIIAVMLGCGLRVAEVSALDVGDYVPGALIVRQGKGGRGRTVPLRADLEALVHALCGRRPKDTPLFLTKRGRRGRLRIPGVREVVEDTAERAGLPRVTPHMLRHTFAFRTYQFSRDALRVSKILGHRDLATTSIYLDHLDLGSLRDAMPDLPL